MMLAPLPRLGGTRYRRFWSNQAMVTLLFTAILIVINLVWVLPALRNVEVGASRLLLQIAERSRAEIASVIFQSEDALQDGAESIAIDPETASQVLATLLKRRPEFFNVALINRNGHEAIRLDRFNLITPDDLADHGEEAGFYIALEGGTYISAVKTSERNEPFITMAVPVGLLGRPQQVLSASFNLKSLITIVGAVRVPGGGRVYVLDRDGTMIVHPDISRVLQRTRYARRSIAQKVLDKGLTADGLDHADWYRDETTGESFFAVGMPVLSEWGLFVEQTQQAALGDKTQVMLIALATTVLGFTLIVFLVRTTHSFIEQGIELARINERLEEILDEQDVGGKLLVRRDLELSEANEKLRTLDQAKSAFVSVAAHQLRTPLSGIKWGLRLIITGDLGAVPREQKEVLEQTYESNERMIALVNDMLDVDRIESGTARFVFGPVALTPIVAAVVSELAPLISKKQIAVTVLEKEKPLPLVTADAAKIRAVVQNLIENAVKYTMDRGTVTVTLEVQGTTVVVAVSDTGIGVPETQRQNIFKRFFRGSNALKVATDGTGLGLFIAKNIIENHGGRIWFETKENSGSTFSFSLPVLSRSSDVAMS